MTLTSHHQNVMKYTSSVSVVTQGEKWTRQTDLLGSGETASGGGHIVITNLAVL